jgi:hypothetical protein
VTHPLRLAIALALLSFIACSSTRDPDKADGGDGDGDGNTAPDGPACFAYEAQAEIGATTIDSVDLLFVVDNSESMRDEQASLSGQFLRLITMLTSGDFDGDGQIDFMPVRNLHLGVASTDLGLPGLESAGIAGCQGLGDRGELRNVASPDVAGCSATTYNPPFLTFEREAGDSLEQTATDLECIATLGAAGCTFEQPLESALKAVWPGNDPSVTFVTDTAGFGMFGNSGSGLPNGDFIRNDPSQPPSLVAIVLVTDEEDCSSRRMDHFVPSASANGLDTRCYYEGLRGAESNLFQVDRYIQLFKMLRPGQEELVIFAGIVGVPSRLTTPDVFEGYDFGSPGQREAYFDMVLAAEEMQEAIDDKGTPDVLDDDNMRPSCDRGTDARAYPPRRIVQVAKGFGTNGLIHSICQEDFTQAINALVDTIAGRLGAPCLPRSIARSSEGLIDCEVTWELPRTPSGGAPTACDQRPFLDATGRVGSTGGPVCKVAQLAVDASASEPEPRGEGWYYDDFSVDTQQACNGSSKQRVAFTSDAQPPYGITVKLSCFETHYDSGDLDRTDLVPNGSGFRQPEIGSPCEMVQRDNETLFGDEACVQRLRDGGEDESLFCHRSTKACALGCSSDADCPQHWSCDDSADAVQDAGRPLCSPGMCSAGASAASPAKVGDPCLPLFVPSDGFSDAHAYVEGNHPFCGGAACLVYHLEGDPRGDCAERGGCVPRAGSFCDGEGLSCADADDVENRVYCSCRCDAPEGFNECQCPGGFSCVDVLDNGPPEIAGGYCVRNGSVIQ